MLFSRSRLTSLRSERRNSVIRALTSSSGRRQFSLLKANRVRTSTPDLPQVSMAARTDFTPAR